MKVDIQKQVRSIKWLTEHSLTEEQRKKLFKEKLERARLGQLDLIKRESSLRAR